MHRLIRTGNIPAVRIGRQWQFRKKDIDAWHERGRVEIERMRLLGYDPLLTELELLGPDGLRTIQEVKRLNATVPTVIATRSSSEANAIEAANIGVSGYLTKSFKFPKVLSVAARVLGD